MNQFLSNNYQLIDGIWLRPLSAQSMTEFTYSDGEDVERRLYSLIENASDKSLFSQELARSIDDWPTRYYLSPTRANLLRPFEPALKKGRVLELGAGCGAITRYLGEIGAEVTAVEGSFTRARIARLRTADLSNVNVVCDRIESFSTNIKFDVITLIGVLEYARAYAPTAGFSQEDLLSHAVSHLDNDGFLVLAIENQLGLKYLAGAQEDHVGVPYFGINDNYRSDTVATFGLLELKTILSKAGLTHHDAFIPLPDYKLPVTVLSPEGAAPTGVFNAEAQITQSVVADHQRPVTPPFSLESALAVSHRNGLAQDLAGSFLIIASRTERGLARASCKDQLAWHYSQTRAPAFMNQTVFVSEGDRIAVKRSRLVDRPPPVVPIENVITDEEYINGNSWSVELTRILNAPGWGIDTLGNWAAPWIELIAEQCQISDIKAVSIHERVDGRYFDATPFNAISDQNGKLRLFDQEWRAKSPLEIGFILFRGLKGSIVRITSYAEPKPDTPRNINRLVMAVLAHQGVLISKGDVERYDELELRFQKWINGELDEQINERLIQEFWTSSLNIRPSAHQVTQLIASNNRLAAARAELLAENSDLLIERNKLLTEIDDQRTRLELQSHEHDELTAIYSSTTWRLIGMLKRLEKRNPTLIKVFRSFLRLGLSLFHKVTRLSN